MALRRVPLSDRGSRSACCGRERLARETVLRRLLPCALRVAGRCSGPRPCGEVGEKNQQLERAQLRPDFV